MAISVNAAVSAEFEEKRRKAEEQARTFKAEVYKKIPALYDIEKRISNTATDYTKRMIGGEDVRAEMNEKLALLFGEKEAMLKLNGFSTDDFKPKYQCLACNDKGVTESGMCSCFRNRVIEENFKNSNIGDSLSHQSFDTFSLDFYPEQKSESYPLSPKENMTRNFKRCKSFAENFDIESKSLLLVGGTGLGKTFLSTCIAKQLLSDGKSVIYISAVDFFKRIENARFDSENTDVLLFESCDLLIIDDLGTEAPSVYTTAVFSDILDKRIRNSKKMILSSNSRFSDFEKLYGARVFSRLAGGFDCLLFYGKDIRIQKFLNKE